MTKTVTTKAMRLGQVRRETRAADPNGVAEFLNPNLLMRIG